MDNLVLRLLQRMLKTEKFDFGNFRFVVSHEMRMRFLVLSKCIFLKISKYFYLHGEKSVS